MSQKDNRFYLLFYDLTNGTTSLEYLPEQTINLYNNVKLTLRDANECFLNRILIVKRYESIFHTHLLYIFRHNCNEIDGIASVVDEKINIIKDYVSKFNNYDKMKLDILTNNVMYFLEHNIDFRKENYEAMFEQLKEYTQMFDESKLMAVILREITESDLNNREDICNEIVKKDIKLKDKNEDIEKMDILDVEKKELKLLNLKFEHEKKMGVLDENWQMDAAKYIETEIEEIKSTLHDKIVMEPKDLKLDSYEIIGKETNKTVNGTKVKILKDSHKLVCSKTYLNKIFNQNVDLVYFSLFYDSFCDLCSNSVLLNNYSSYLYKHKQNMNIDITTITNYNVYIRLNNDVNITYHIQQNIIKYFALFINVFNTHDNENKLNMFGVTNNYLYKVYTSNSFIKVFEIAHFINLQCKRYNTDKLPIDPTTVMDIYEVTAYQFSKVCCASNVDNFNTDLNFISMRFATRLIAAYYSIYDIEKCINLISFHAAMINLFIKVQCIDKHNPINETFLNILITNLVLLTDAIVFGIDGYLHRIKNDGAIAFKDHVIGKINELKLDGESFVNFKSELNTYFENNNYNLNALKLKQLIISEFIDIIIDNNFDFTPEEFEIMKQEIIYKLNNSKLCNNAALIERFNVRMTPILNLFKGEENGENKDTDIYNAIINHNDKLSNMINYDFDGSFKEDDELDREFTYIEFIKSVLENGMCHRLKHTNSCNVYLDYLFDSNIVDTD